MFNWVEEFKKANDAYQLALQQESNAEFDYMEIAISNTNAAKIHLDNVIKRAKLGEIPNVPRVII